MEDESLRKKITGVHEHTSSAEIDEIITSIKNSGAIERSLSISDRYLNKAIDVLNQLPNNRAKKTLRDIAVYIGKRKF